MSIMSLSVTDGVATFTNEHGYVFTASNIAVEPGDEISVDLTGAPYLVVRREGAEMDRYPMLDQSGWHFSEQRAMLAPPNPLLSAEGVS